MQAADDVKFRRAFCNALRCALVDLIQRERVSAGCVRRASESAKAAMRYANIRGVNVPVDVVIADISVLLLADVIPKPAERKQIVRLVKRDAVFRIEALAGENLRRYWLQSRVRYFKFARRLHFDLSGTPNNCRGAPEQKE